MSVYERNLAALLKHWPRLHARVMACPERDAVAVQERPDGVTYGLRSERGFAPLTDMRAALQRLLSRMERQAAALANLARPILLVGLAPGDELLHLFGQCEAQPPPRPEQPIHVCLNSIPAFIGFLRAFDARPVLASPRVRWFAAEDWAAEIRFLESRPDYPCVFTALGGLPDAEQAERLAPFLALARRRDRETLAFCRENNDWYAALDDARLAAVIAGRDAETPRLLMVTSAWSNVTQYAARDLATAFESLDWSVRRLNMDLMLTPYFIAGEIHRFQPHVFLFINHLRTEARPVYPPDMLFVTWIQDSLEHVNNSRAAAAWNAAVQAAARRRDLLVGYSGQLAMHGYAKERLLPLPMIVNTDLFKPRRLTPAQQRQYGCDVCFTSNSGRPTDIALRDEVVPALERILTESRARHPAPAAPVPVAPLAAAVHDWLWERYRAGFAFTTIPELESALTEHVNRFAALTAALDPDGKHAVMDLLFWFVNDVVYRHVVLEWLDELGADLRLYGDHWNRHPRFARYAGGKIEHGAALSVAYRAARFCLHLNSMEGAHQRIGEILASGGRLLTRACRRPAAPVVPDLVQAWQWLNRRILELGLEHPDTFQLEALTDPRQRACLSDWLFVQAKTLPDGRSPSVPPCPPAQQVVEIPSARAAQLARRVEQALAGRMDAQSAIANKVVFHDKASLARTLTPDSRSIPPTTRQPDGQ